VRVLIVGINYPPEATGIAPYTAGLAEHLAARGDDVTVMTGLPSYPQWRVFDGYRHVLGRRESIGGVDVRRRWHHVPHRQSAVRRGLYEATFLATGLSTLTLPRPDAILGIVPSLSGGMVAWLAGRRFRAPYGLVFQDLLGPAAAQSGVEGGGRTARLVRATEGLVARDAEAVGVIAEGFRSYLEDLGVDPWRIHRVRNWTHVGEPTVDRAATREQLGLPHDAVVCLHAGNMGYKQGLANVVECARLAIPAHPELLFVLMGDGNQRAELEELAAGYGLANLRFLPIQPAELFPSVLAAADVLLLNQRAAVTDMSLPGKLTSYFFSARPVLAAVSAGSETAREIYASGAGRVASPDDPHSLLEALLGLAADRGRRERLGQAGIAYARSMLTAEQALAGLESLIAAIAARQTPAEEVMASP
jgi:glycosyltransferase involved in cell wall biosynthesis